MRDFVRVQAFVCCCFLGGLVGMALSGGTLVRWALGRYRAEHPGEYVCGMFPLPYLFLGLLGGGAVGALAGWRVQRRLAGLWRQPAPPCPTAEPGAPANGGRDPGP
jgi:hypothetical protein